MSDVTLFIRKLLPLVRDGANRYQFVLGIPGTRGFFFASAIARLGVAMTGLGLLWTVHGLTGSFAIAGAATGIFALSEALAGPQLARLIDRYGQFRIIPVLLILHVVGVGLVVAASAAGDVAMILIGAVVAGAAVPQPGALSATRWTYLIQEPVRLRTAFSLEAVVNDVVFLAGPPIVTVVSGLTRPYLGTVVAASFLVLGGIALALQRGTEPSAKGKGLVDRQSSSTLLTRGFICVFGVNLGLGFFFGAVPIIVTAFSSAQGYGAAAGFILGITSVASLLSGIVYGAMKERWQPHTVQIAATLLLFTAIGISTVSLTLPMLCFALLLAGMTISPVMVTSSQIVVANVGRASLTRGFTWINTASATGIALAASVTGFAVETGGVRAALLTCCALVTIAPASALARGKARVS